GLKFNLDRPEHFAVAGHPALVSRPGEFGVLEGGKAAVVFLPPSAHTVSVARGRGGIDLAGSSFVEVRGLAFENMTDGGPTQHEALANSSDASDILIEHNRFQYFRMPQGAGAIAINFVRNLTIADNGISAYLVNHGVKIVANTVTDAVRPITYEGAPPGENDLEFTGNLLIGTPDSDTAL